MNTLKFLVMVAVSVAVFWGAQACSPEKGGDPEKGKILYEKMRCYYCHRIGDIGGIIGPDLTKMGTKNRGIEWHIRNLKDTASTHPTKHPDPRMPQFDKLTEKMFQDLAAYLESLK